MGTEQRDVIQELRQRIQRGAETRSRAGPDAGEACRHMDVVADGLHHEIGRVAEGLVGLSERLDWLEANVCEQIRGSTRELCELMRSLVDGERA